MSAITFRAAWQKADPDLERDAKEYWRGGRRKLPQHVAPDDRVGELCAVAYREDRPVGVSTARIETVGQFRCRMAMYRCAVTIGLRHTPLSWRITEYSQDLLERWSLENPDEKVMGVLAVIQSRELVLRYPQVFAPANMVFAGFSAAGLPIRVAWFKHAAIPTEWPPRPTRMVEPPETKVKAKWGGEILVSHNFKESKTD
jgi:hypothetical protein